MNWYDGPHDSWYEKPICGVCEKHSEDCGCYHCHICQEHDFREWKVKDLGDWCVHCAYDKQQWEVSFKS